MLMLLRQGQLLFSSLLIWTDGDYSLRDDLGNLAIVVAVIFGICQFFHYLLQYNEKRNEEIKNSFDGVVKQLSEESPSAQLSAASLLRRFLVNKQKSRIDLKEEAVRVISSQLRTLPTGVFQKTLGDGLAYTFDLAHADLTRTNLQDVYIGSKHGRIDMSGADLFMSDMSYALMDNVDARGAQFYNTILFNAHIKNCDLSDANFMNADLESVYFKNTVLSGARFDKARNIPSEIQSRLVDGIYRGDFPVTVSPEKNGKSVFFSMPSSMTKEDELLTKEYRECLEELGYTVVYYQRDDYPKFGQLNKVRHNIESSDAMIAFGLRQINITQGVSKPGTSEEIILSDTWLPTPWNEIEVGMGLMAGIPVLLVKDDSINSGIFDNSLSECFVWSVTKSQIEGSDIKNNREFLLWLARVRS